MSRDEVDARSDDVQVGSPLFRQRRLLLEMADSSLRPSGSGPRMLFDQRVLFPLMSPPIMIDSKLDRYDNISSHAPGFVGKWLPPVLGGLYKEHIKMCESFSIHILPKIISISFV